MGRCELCNRTQDCECIQRVQDKADQTEKEDQLLFLTSKRKGDLMGKIKAHAQDFLEDGGYELGYDMSNLPEIQDFKYGLEKSLDAQQYSEQRAKMMKEVEEFKQEVKDLINKSKKVKNKQV